MFGKFKCHVDRVEKKEFGGLEFFNGDDLIMSATAYYLGRRTIGIEFHCQCLIRAWPRLPEHVREYIQRLVKSEFAREEIIRRTDLNFNSFGDACDRESWCKVRECWRQPQQAKPEPLSFGESMAKYEAENLRQ